MRHSIAPSSLGRQLSPRWRHRLLPSGFGGVRRVRGVLGAPLPIGKKKWRRRIATACEQGGCHQSYADFSMWEGELVLL